MLSNGYEVSCSRTQHRTAPQVRIEPATFAIKSPMLSELSYWCSPRSTVVYLVTCISEWNRLAQAINFYLSTHRGPLLICLSGSFSRMVQNFNPFHCIPLSAGVSGLVKKNLDCTVLNRLTYIGLHLISMHKPQR